MRLSSVRIFVDDLAKAATFYEGVVGLTRSTTAPTAILYEESPSIVVEAADEEARREGLLGRFTGVSFETSDAVALHADLKERGIPMNGPSEKQEWSGIMLFVRDPSGKHHHIHQYPSQAASSRGP